MTDYKTNHRGAQLRPTELARSTGVKPAATDADFRAQLAGFSLTTAEILYRLPDYPALLQSYIWQDYDMAPRFPKLKAFLDFWTTKLEGPLYKVTVAHARLIRPAELKLLDASAMSLLEQEIESATGARVELVMREVLPRLHPAYAALLAMESTDPARRREAARELRTAAERGSLSASLLRRLLVRMRTEQDRLVWQDVIAAITPDALPEAAQIGLIALNSPWPDLRQLGCDYFERHPQPEYAAWILPRLQDTDRQVQLRAVRLLARCGNPAALDGYAEDEAAAGGIFEAHDLRALAVAVLGRDVRRDPCDTALRDGNIARRIDLVLGVDDAAAFQQQVVGCLCGQNNGGQQEEQVAFHRGVFTRLTRLPDSPGRRATSRRRRTCPVSTAGRRPSCGGRRAGGRTRAAVAREASRR